MWGINRHWRPIDNVNIPTIEGDNRIRSARGRLPGCLKSRGSPLNQVGKLVFIQLVQCGVSLAKVYEGPDAVQVCAVLVRVLEEGYGFACRAKFVAQYVDRCGDCRHVNDTYEHRSAVKEGRRVIAHLPLRDEAIHTMLDSAAQHTSLELRVFRQNEYPFGGKAGLIEDCNTHTRGEHREDEDGKVIVSKA